MDGGAGVGGDRITHPAGPLWPKILWATLHADWCGEKDKIRREPYGGKEIDQASSGDGKDPRGKSKLQPIGLEPTNPLPTLRIVGAPATDYCYGAAHNDRRGVP